MRAPAFVPNDEAPLAQHPAQQHATLHQLPRRYACDIEGDSVPGAALAPLLPSCAHAHPLSYFQRRARLPGD